MAANGDRPKSKSVLDALPVDNKAFPGDPDYAGPPKT